jgi:D-sedoheptulose 7-phosphate isomerase
MTKAFVTDSFKRRAVMWEQILASDLHVNVQKSAARMITALKKGRKILVFGNGGSAAEAQHFAAELVGRFERDRQGMAALALTTDASILTAQANDAGYDSVFSRQIEALARPGDIVIGMTTSDVTGEHSANILKAFQAAKKAKAYSIGLFSIKTKKLLSYVDLALQVPETNTALIQEVHLAILHIVSGLIEG